MTIVVTGVMLVSLAFLIKRHYVRVREQLRRLDEQLLDIPVRPHTQEHGEIRHDEPVAVMLVNGFSGLGVHTVLSVQSLFPHQYKSYVFVSVGVIDSAIFKGQAEVEALKRHTIEDLEKYVDFAQQAGLQGRVPLSRSGPRPWSRSSSSARTSRREFPRSIFYLGQLVFENDRFYYRLLHNETAFAIQRRLQFAGPPGDRPADPRPGAPQRPPEDGPRMRRRIPRATP